MPKFLLLLEGLAAQPAASDEETQAYNRKWAQWIGSLVQAGSLESGLPLAPVAKVVSMDAVTERPLATRDIYGFLVITAPTLGHVVDLVRQAPHTSLGGTTIVRPCLDIPGMG